MHVCMTSCVMFQVHRSTDDDDDDDDDASHKDDIEAMTTSEKMMVFCHFLISLKPLQIRVGL